MPQKTSPFIEAKYGWSLGESGWNGGMDENLLKFSFLLTGTVDDISDTLPTLTHGTSVYLRTDNRLYFAVSGVWHSSPVPKWFSFTVKATGKTYQFNGTSLVEVPTTSELDSRVDAVESTTASLGTAAFESISTFATTAQLDVSEGVAAAYTDVLRNDVTSKTDGSKGAGLIGYNGRTVAAVLSESVSILDGPNPVTGDNTEQDRQRLIAILEAATLANKPVVVPPGIWQFSNWIPLPDKLKLIFMPGAVWKLTEQTNLGGFVCGGYTVDLIPRPFTDVEIYNIDLDCSDLPNENGFNAINAVNVKLYNPKVKNVKFSTVNQGGKAFQFEGSVVDGVHVYNPYIENATIGINSHADPLGGAEVVRHVSYYNVVMRNVDVPFNIDGQFANPEAGSFTNMSTFVNGVNLFNCGKLTYVGNSDSLGGGIVCGDRGLGLKITGLRLINDAEYGAIGSVIRGTMFDVQLRDFQIVAPSVKALVDLTPVGYGLPSTGGHVCRIDASGVSIKADMDYIAKGYVPAKMGRSFFEVSIDSSIASLIGICDSNAASSGLGYLDLSLSDVLGFRTQLQSFSSLFANGNSTALCLPIHVEGPWTAQDTSGAALTLSGVSGYYVREGRKVTANFRVDYPTTSDTRAAKLGNLPFTSFANSSGGSVTFSFKGALTLATGLVRPGVKEFEMFTASGTPITNADLSGQTLIGSVNYFAT